MAKKSMIEREKKRRHLVINYKKKRETLKEEIKTTELFEEKLTIHRKLQLLPRDSSATRLPQSMSTNRKAKRVFPGFWSLEASFTGDGPQLPSSRGYEIELVDVTATSQGASKGLRAVATNKQVVPQCSTFKKEAKPSKPTHYLSGSKAGCYSLHTVEAVAMQAPCITL